MTPLLAHPLTDPGRLGLPPLTGALLALVGVVAVVTLAPAAPRRDTAASGGDTGGLRRVPLTTVIGVAVLAAVIIVGYAGPADEAANLAPVFGVYLAWPGLLVVAALVGGAAWRRVDPFTGLAAGVERLVGGSMPTTPDDPDVWPAVAAALAWTGFLTAYAVGVPPPALANALVVYTTVMVAGSLATGRERWLRSAEVFGLLAAWVGLRRELVSWGPPRGAEAVLGALIGGLLFSRVVTTSLWGPAAVSEQAGSLRTAGLLVAAGGGAALATAAGGWARRRGAPGTVPAALVPAVAAVAVALMLRPAMTAAQLLPRVVGDPLRRGQDPFGLLGTPVDANVFGTAVQQGLALAVVVLGHLAGAVVLVRRTRSTPRRTPGGAALAVSASLAAALVLTA